MSCRILPSCEYVIDIRGWAGRHFSAEDLAGHRWTFSQPIADVDPQEWGGMLLESAEDTA
jgi:hypothetical protein